MMMISSVTAFFLPSCFTSYYTLYKAMSTRIRDENLNQSSRRTGHGPTKKVLGNENTITPNKPSLRRPTLASSLKATPKPGQLIVAEAISPES